MPSKSPAQARMMAAAANDPKFAKKVGVSQYVAREFNQADKGGEILSRAMRQKPKKKHGSMEKLMGLKS